MANETTTILELSPTVWDTVKSAGYIVVSVSGHTYKLPLSQLNSAIPEIQTVTELPEDAGDHPNTFYAVVAEEETASTQSNEG